MAEGAFDAQRGGLDPNLTAAELKDNLYRLQAQKRRTEKEKRASAADFNRRLADIEDTIGLTMDALEAVEPLE